MQLQSLKNQGKRRYAVEQNFTSIQASPIQVREYLRPLGILKEEGAQDAILAIN